MSVGNEGLFGGRESELVLDRPTDRPRYPSKRVRLLNRSVVVTLFRGTKFMQKSSSVAHFSILPTDFERDHGGGLVLALLVRASMALA